MLEAIFSTRKPRNLPPNLVAGGAIIMVLGLLAAAGPLLTPYDPNRINLLQRFAPPGLEHWFGCDEYGRDVLARVLYGARLSLMMGVFATTISVAVGVPVGLVVGYRRGWLDELIMRVMDILMSFPPIMLGLLVLAVTRPALWKAIIAVGIVYIPGMVRVTRSVTLNVAHEEFIEAAEARGDRTWYILVFEILPNAWPPIAVDASLRTTFAILLGAALTFLGMGAQPPSSDWGLMISEARPFLDPAPWIALAPGIAMCLAVIGINLFGDGLREMLDVRVQDVRVR